MIAPIKQALATRPAWHEHFLAMYPDIARYLRMAFRNLDAEAREEAVAEGLANACAAYRRLVEQNRTDRAFPTVLARFAAAQVIDGRRIGSGQNSRDVLSRRAQRKKRFHVDRLDRFCDHKNGWLEAVVEDPRTPVFDQVCFRIDFPAWLARLSCRNRRIAEALALGDSTQAVARRFQVSPGRISQLRRELHRSWHGYTEGTDSLETLCATSA